ncbi:hypothetical protein CMI47_21945 [Candidatus Pacearchaeota archaeon]|nr:hypothetical protein [Candidatus Pacearchaeota archaeon]|tara:strand:- start:10520 stop:10852 length:333 start_codon:yes stop_codon:yes gene_type:complete
MPKLNNLSYDKYLKHELSTISENFSIRQYKLAPKEEYPFFERGRDIRVRLFWKDEPIYEFLVEKTFFFQSNRNDDDRKYMRLCASSKIEMIKEAYKKSNKNRDKVCHAIR